MTADLRSQLEEYTSAVVERQRPVTASEAQALVEVIRHLPEIRDRKTPHRMRRIRAAATLVAAAAVVLVLVSVVAWLTRRSPGTDVIDQPTVTSMPTPTTAPGESTPTTLDELPPIPGTWSRIQGPAGGFGEGVIGSVAAGGPGLVAVGMDAYPYGEPALWVSVDGAAWTELPLDEEVFGDGGPRSVIAAGPGLVAVGDGVWTSGDGISWSRVPDEEGVFQDAEILSVAVGGPGLVAVGVVGGGEFDHGAVWTSVDGTAWSRVPHDDDAFGGRSPGVDITMSQVAAGGPGLVAVGMDWSRSDADAAAWTSEDGLTWARVPDDGEVFGGSGHQAINSVIAAGPGLIAVGTERAASQQAAVWTSVDGLTWSRVDRDESGSLDGGQMNSVVVADPGLVAVGWLGWVGGPDSEAVVWTSTDGVTWNRASDGDSAIGSGLMSHLINTGQGLVAVGTDGTNAAVWVRPSDRGGEQ